MLLDVCYCIKSPFVRAGSCLCGTEVPRKIRLYSQSLHAPHAHSLGMQHSEWCSHIGVIIRYGKGLVHNTGVGSHTSIDEHLRQSLAMWQCCRGLTLGLDAMFVNHGRQLARIATHIHIIASLACSAPDDVVLGTYLYRMQKLIP